MLGKLYNFCKHLFYNLFCHATNLKLFHGAPFRVAAAALVEAVLAVALPVAQRLATHAARAQARNLPAAGVALSACGGQFNFETKFLKGNRF